MHNNFILNLYTVCELNDCPCSPTNNITLKNCLLGTAKLTRDADKSTFTYNGRGIVFDRSIRMSGKSINFDDKKISKSNFYENKNIFNIYDLDVNKILVSKKESHGKKIHLNTSLDIMMMMMSLDHYVKNFLN